MCILLFTLPDSNHPRYKFAFASNRDEFMARDTSTASFWDLDAILESSQSKSNDQVDTLSSPPNFSATVGILSGQDLQPSKTENYTIKEVERTESGEERTLLSLTTHNLPGTWLGITTHGDLVALTNYRESLAYMAESRQPKLSRGKVCGEYLVTMAAAHLSAESKTSRRGLVRADQAEQWIRKRAVGWESEFEGLNLLVVQNGGDQMYVGGNREGSELVIFSKNAETAEAVIATEFDPKLVHEMGSNTSSSGTAAPIQPCATVAGVSNSIFTRPWTKVDVGTLALEKVLDNSVKIFGQGTNAVLEKSSRTSNLSDDSKEIAWLVIEMLKLLRNNTTPFKEEGLDVAGLLAGLRERVFIPKINLGGADCAYGTRSSTVVLFGRQNGQAVFVEKTWYGPASENGDQVQFAPDSTEGLVWWQGIVGRPEKEWKKIEGPELAELVQSVGSL